MDKYTILNEIRQGYFSKGYFSKGYLVENTIDKTKYAVKFCDKSDKYYSYILNEIETLKKLQHKNIIKMKEYFHDEKKTYLILEYFNSTTLNKAIAENFYCNKKKITNQIIEAGLVKGMIFIHFSLKEK